VAVRALKRFAADYAVRTGYLPPSRAPANDGEKVAIVGSGPAGLMSAYRLANKGYDVTVFEALDVPGGALAACIPDYRLPRDMLLRDVENIKRAGVKIKTNTRIGKDISFERLRSDYRAVFIATGAHKSRKLGIPNEDAEGILDSMEFLKDVNLGREVKIGRRVGVIGGGNSAVDAARVAVRTKPCEEVSIIYRRTEAEMPAFREEVEAAAEEGIQLQLLTAPAKIVTSDGKVRGVECLRMELGEPDQSGRRRPVPIEGSEFVIDLDTLIVAISEDPDLSFLGEEHGIELSRWNTPAINRETFATNVEGVFAGGDAVTGPNTVIDAMAAGKHAAEMIDKYIRGESVEREYQFVRPSMYLSPVELSEEEMEQAERPDPVTLPPPKRIGNFDEVELGISEEAAVREARRCLRCDLQTEEGKEQMDQMRNAGGCGCE